MHRGIRAVAFDAYDTLCYIADPAHPFAALMGRDGKTIAAMERLFMTASLDASAFLERVGGVSAADQAEIEGEIRREVESVRLFDDAIEVLDRLRARGLQLAVVSNLALPYAPPVQALLGERIDRYIWSFEVGAIKPDAAIFEAACSSLGLSAAEVLMVGDSRISDFEGGQRAGLPALHLTRAAGERTAQSILGLADVITWLDTQEASA